jgi:glycosyltransferase involved in cell wall biosynthesis
MSHIRVAHIVEATTGGVARHVIDLVTRFDPALVSCVLYVSFERPDSWVAPFRALAEHGVVIHEIGMARSPNPAATRQLAGWARRDAVDLLHLHSAKAGYLGRQAAPDVGVPVIYTPHAFPFQRTTDWRRPLYRMIERKLATRTDRIICVSDGECKEALAVGLPEEKLVIIPNGIDPALWPVPSPEQRKQIRRSYGVTDDEMVIGAMARLAPQKGIDLLLEAAEDILPDFPQARILIWGDGPQRKRLRGLARRLRLQRVTFLGNTEHPWNAYAAMDIFCAPSRWEGGPYAVLEAMACGLPVVASEVAGHTDCVEDDVTGRLVTPELPGPIAGALRSLLVDSYHLRLLGQAGRRRLEKAFTLEHMVRSTEALYQEVLVRQGAIHVV